MKICAVEPAYIPQLKKLGREVAPVIGAFPGGDCQLSIDQELAFCIRKDTEIMAAVLVLEKPPASYYIRWIAVTEKRRREGLAQILLERCFEIFEKPCTVEVITFAAIGTEEARAARRLYKSLGFIDGEIHPDNRERQYLRLKLDIL